jgi:inorganic phosphate transporter, PiT family
MSEIVGQQVGWLIIAIVAFALLFDFTNGFHDAANAIAAVVGTNVLSYREAVALAALGNLIGAFFATRVALTIEHGLVMEPTQVMVLAALIGAIAWNFTTWWFGLPSSSSHALIGGLVGAAIGHIGAGSVIWRGVWDKVVEPMIVSPVLGFVLGVLIMWIIDVIIKRKNIAPDAKVFRHLQLGSAGAMALAHGSNDAQKTMGIITMALVVAGLHTPGTGIPTWVILVCSLAMCLGTLSGGKRIVMTAGKKLVPLLPPSGFAATASSAIVVFTASAVGAPVSTTHVVIGGIAGAGSQFEHQPIDRKIVRAMIVAWFLTLPAAAIVALFAYLILIQLFGL